MRQVLDRFAARELLQGIRLRKLFWRTFGNDLATELARLYPSFSPDALKENMNTFAVVNGPIRRMRASSALKSALKARQEALTTPSAE